MSGRDSPDDTDRARLLERMSDGYLSLDDDWTVADINPYGREMLWSAGDDAPDGDLLGRNLWDTVPESRDSVYYEKFHEAATRDQAVEFEARLPGTRGWFDVRVFPDDDGVSVFLTPIADDTERQRRIREREAVVEELYGVFQGEAPFEAKVESLLVLGREVLGTEFGTLSRIEGDRYTFEVVDAADGSIKAGDTVDLTWTNCEQVVLSQQKLVLSDIVTQRPDLADGPGNEKMGLSCYIGTPVECEGEVYGTLCFYDRDAKDEPFSEWEAGLIDVMALLVSYELDRRSAERRLRRRNERLEAFSSVLSHDLRNPLAVAQGYVDTAIETDDLSHLEEVEDSLERMQSIIDDVLYVSRTEGPPVDAKPVSVARLAEAAWAMVRTGESELRVTATGEVAADDSLLQRLFENLYSNAVSHNSEPVSVEVGDLDDGFYVADTGSGIDGDPGAVFEPGASVDSRTGLGLAIVREIAEAHGWSYRLTESEVGGVRLEFGDVDVSGRD